MALLTPVAHAAELADLGPVHFIAIGGSGMNGIAAMMLASGVPVSGSDRQDSKYLRSLEAAGARCTWGTGPSSWAMPRRSWPPRPFARTTPNSPRPGAGSCACCTAVPHSAR